MPTQTHLAESSAVQTEVYIDGHLVDAVPGVAIAQYQAWLQTWLIALDPKQSPIHTYEVNLRLTDDAEIQQLNTDYRQQANPTDVLSFAALETTLPGAESLAQEQPLCLGDIIISVETAARQAKSANHSLPTEIAWLTAHGLLHLLGWDHPDDDSLVAMLKKQAELLSLIALT